MLKLKNRIIDGYWWYKGNSKLKFRCSSFYLMSWEQLRRAFNFKTDNFILEIDNIGTIKKYGYNFFLNNKKIRRNEIIKKLGITLTNKELENLNKEEKRQ